MANNRLTTRIILRNDSSTEWLANSSQVLLKGEVGIEFLETGKVKMKVGDGQHTWAQLPYFGGDECHVTEVEVAAGADHASAISEATKNTAINKGDIAIVKEGIIAANDPALSQGSVVQKYQYTAYVYGETSDGTAAWKAMDGNYSAENVYFDKDMLVTKEVGYITLTNGQAYIPSKGKNLTEVFEAMYVKEQNPTTSAPYVELSFSQAGVYEVGSKLTPTYSASFNAGKYSYGPATGVTVTAWEVTDSAASKTLKTSSGSFDEIQITDDTSYKITAKATHTAGTVPVTNKGNPFVPASITATSGQIQEGTKTKTSSAITGARKAFYGAFVDAINLNSNEIRTKCTSKWHTDTTTCAWYTGAGYELIVPDQTTQVVVCLYGKTLKGVYDKAAFGTDIKDSFKIQTSTAIPIQGANEYTGVNYNVYVYTPDAALGANTYYIAIG